MAPFFIVCLHCFVHKFIFYLILNQFVCVTFAAYNRNQSTFMHKLKSICLFFLLLGLGFVCRADSYNARSSYQFLTIENYMWAEQVMHSMSLEEKIAQLLMISVYPDGSDIPWNETLSIVRKYHPGGVCFFSGTPIRQIRMTNRLQALSKIPMLVAIDGEWGPSMRLDSCVRFPRQMLLGALPERDVNLVYRMGLAVGKQCQCLGIHINFAPCVDVNNNPQNPVINSRSFGERPDKVAMMSIAYMQGMQDVSVAACAKHFPGHGDTQVDSHFSLPIITKSLVDMEARELYPFRRIVDAGVQMVMVGHLRVPALDSASNSISSLSKPIVTDFLRNNIGFDGLVITDAMGMKAVRSQYPANGEAEIRALLAGVDIVLMPSDLSVVIPAIKAAVRQGRIPEELIEERCRRVLAFKSSKGLNETPVIDTKGVEAKLNLLEDNVLVDSLEAEAMTLLRNEGNILPLVPSVAEKSLLLLIGSTSDTAYYSRLAKERGMGYLQVSRDAQPSQYISTVAPYDQVVVVTLNTNQTPSKNYGITDEMLKFLNVVLEGKKVVLGLMGNPYALPRFSNLEKYQAVVVGYTCTKSIVETFMDHIFGERDFSGTLPVSVDGFVAGSGMHLPVQQPVQLEPQILYDNFSALSDRTTYRIDSLVTSCIKMKVMPGCQILAMKSGKLLFYKNYGSLRYDKKQPVTTETMYDLASMTKALSTTLALMKLYDEGKIDIEAPLSTYVPASVGTQVGTFTLKELMTHTTGLPAGLLFYKHLMSDKKWSSQWVRTKPTEGFSVCAAQGMYLRDDFPKVALQMILDCKVTQKKYIYSDLNFILLKEVVEAVSGRTLDVYVMENFYKPLGLVRTGYNPLTFIQDGNIAPTENDTYFRFQQLQGYVHDPSAAVFGCVSGNAGLFSTAQEVSVLMSMLINGGEYKGYRCLSKATVDKFTAVCPMHGCDRRGLGFDMPAGGGTSTIIPTQASQRTFGHQGFTGTVFWCDPDNGLTYVFLSNRVFPKAQPNNLSKSRLRYIVHEEIYKDIERNNK